MRSTTVAVIGAGASALTLCRQLRDADVDFVVIDKGSFERNPDDPHDIANGFGGAALYSDGKISFKPAGTGVWKLDNHKGYLEKALRATVEMINEAYSNSSEEAQEECEGFPLDVNEIAASLYIDDDFVPEEDRWVYKEYVSVYIPLETRLKLIEEQYKAISENYIPTSIVHSVECYDEKYLIKYQNNDDFVNLKKIEAQYVVVCGGRFAPLFLKIPFMRRIFKRTEIGVRLSSPTSSELWKQILQRNSDGIHNDPKYILDVQDEHKSLQYRTFCCCNDGEIVKSKFNGIVTLSGRSDRKSTGMSNIGFTMRDFDSSPVFGHMMKRGIKPFKMSYEEFLNSRVYGIFHLDFTDGLKQFRELYDISECEVSGPCIEGVGEYWRINSCLKDAEGSNVWVAGDSTGLFRGLCAALVSGHYIGSQIIEQIAKGKILNKIYSDKAYLNNAPELTGTTSPALYEIHIFLTVNPTREQYEKYVRCVEEYNRQHRPVKPMKACYLALDFTHGEVTVLQTARYFPCDDINQVVSECHSDAEYFTRAGFDVIREKIEVSVHGVKGLPGTAEEFKLYGKRYFEFHIRVESKDHPETEELTPDEHAELLRFSKTASDELHVPVPLSYNKAKSLEGVYQRFLNLRLRDTGVEDALKRVDEFCKLVDNETSFVVKKRICEYIVYDSFVALDKGWIDF